MERTITIGSGVSQFTLKPGDKAVIQLPFISDEHELKMEQVRAQWNNRHSVRSRLEYVLGKLHRLLTVTCALPQRVLLSLVMYSPIEKEPTR